jgi:hypothetical protein
VLTHVEKALISTFSILGNRHNFNKYTRSQIDSLNIPYDYGSIMHYGKRAFSNNGRDTIVPKKAGVSTFIEGTQPAVFQAAVCKLMDIN